MGKLREDGERRWALLRTEAIPDLDDPDRTYIWRLRVIQCPLFGVYLHRIEMDDGYRPMHDHRWGFLGIVLWGGYTEETLYDGERTWRTGSVHRIGQGEFHAIRKLIRTPTWSLVFVGRRRGDWGFLVDCKWVPHKTFIAGYQAAKNGQPTATTHDESGA